MSWTDKEIDNLFNESAAAQSFEYDNAYFTEMEAASLPVNKTGKDFLWMGTALLFIAVLTVGYFVNNTTENSFNGTNNQLANLEVINGTTTDSKSSTDKQQSANSTAEVSDRNEKSLNTELTTAGVTDATSSNSKGIIGQNSASSSSQEKETITSTVNLNPTALVAENGTITPVNPSGQNATGSNGEQVINLTQENPVLTSTGSTEIRSDIASPKVKRELDIERMPITGLLSTKSANGIDQGLDRSLMLNALPVLGQLRPKSAFYLELNGGVSQSLITPSEFTSTSYGGGFGVESYFGKFNLTTGLNFKLSEHKDLSLTRSAYHYDFGSTLNTGTYDYGKIYSIELPISLGYTFGKHNVNIGVRPSVLIGAKVMHRSFENKELTEAEVSYESADGLKRFGLKPTLGYSYHINKWTIGANVGVQLMQSVNEEFINGFNNGFPVDGQVYLRRTIRLRK